MPVERVLQRLKTAPVCSGCVPLLLAMVLSACGGGSDHGALLIEIFDSRDLEQAMLTVACDDIADIELHTGGAAHGGAFIRLRDPTDLIQVRDEIPWGRAPGDPRFRVAVGVEALWGEVVLAGTSAYTGGPQLIVDPYSGADPHGVLSASRTEAVDSVFLLTWDYTIAGEDLKEAVYAACSG